MKSKSIGYLQGYQILANALAEEAKLTVQFHSQCIPHTTADGILHLPSPAPGWTEDDWEKLLCSLYHETGHHMPEVQDIFPLLEKENINPESTTFAILNMIDDYRNDNNRRDFYAGKRQLVDSSYNRTLTSIADNLEKRKTWEISEADETMLATFVLDSVARAVDNPVLQVQAKRILEALPESVQEKADKLINNHSLVEKYVSCKTAEDEFNLVKEIFEEIDYEDPNPTQGVGEGEGGEGEGEGEESGNEKGDEDSNGKNKSSKDQQGPAQELKDELLQDDHRLKVEYTKDKPEVGELKKSLQESIVNPGDYGPTENNFATEDEVTIWDISDPKDPKVLFGSPCNSAYGLKASRGAGRYTSFVRDTMKCSPRYINTIRRLIQIKTTSRYMSNQRKGRMNGSSLSKVYTQPGAKHPTIYKRKIEGKSDDARISILVDNSGSMGGEKQDSAFRACVYLSELCNALRIPYEVAFFTDSYKCNHIITKPFSKPGPTEEQLAGQFSVLENCMGGNSDADSVHIAHQRLLRAGTEKRKLLFVLSDGQPAGCRHINDYEMLRDTVKDIEDGSPVSIMGIGIKSTAVTDYYSNYLIINKNSELEQSLVNLIKHTILD